MKYRGELSQYVSLAAACALALVCLAACSADDGEDDLRTPPGFSGTGGLVGASGVGAAVSGGANAGSGGSGSSQPGLAGRAADTQGAAGGSSNLPDGTCATANTTTEPVTPTIWLVVDGSSSMRESFGNTNRWLALRSSLMDPGGIVESLQSVVRFGLVIYAGGASDPAQCVQLVTVDPALDNHAAIAAMYPMQWLASGTPTDKALDHVVNNLPVTNMQVLDDRAQPTYVVLATDGEPNDRCGSGNAGSATNAVVQQRVVDVVTRGTANGMNMFVISLAGNDGALQQHLATVAMATETKTPPFSPATQADLIDTFQKIVGGASCQIDLNGKVDVGQECAGKVTMNGSELACASDDGWRLLDPDTFMLTGQACSKFLSMQSLVNAAFPCEVFSPD